MNWQTSVNAKNHFQAIYNGKKKEGKIEVLNKLSPYNKSNNKYSF